MYAPLNVNTHYSLMRGYGKPDKLLKACADYGYGACAITDYELLAGSVDFYEEAKEQGIKPIIGTKIKIINGVNSGYLSLLAVNKTGWKELVKLSTRSWTNEDPCLQLYEILDKKNLICISGDYDSLMDEKSIKLLKEDYADNFYMGGNHHLAKDCAESESIKLIEFNPVLYVTEQEKQMQLLMYSSQLGIKAKNWHLEKDVDFLRYYTNNYSLQKENEIKIKNDFIKEIVEKCEDYSILGRPSLPKFSCPNGMSEADYMLELCRAGWTKKCKKPLPHPIASYVSRIKSESAVIQKAKLEGYFLIVQDYVNWAKNKGWLIGEGRGSAAGCLLSYLLNITNLDPLEYGLLFERFYNDGRNTEDKVALPDIDVDFPPDKREEVIEYIKSKYGGEYTCQVATFGSLQGRGALKEVLRVHDVFDNKKLDEITKKLPQKDKISDKLEEEQEVSIIRWTLRNEPKNLEDMVTMDDDGNLSGELARYFKEAIEIESTYKTYGKHASALVVSGDRLDEVCPMIREKNGNELIAGIEYTALEKMGLPKLDILGTTVLKKLMGVQELLS